jgi:hypothetical protein
VSPSVSSDPAEPAAADSAAQGGPIGARPVTATGTGPIVDLTPTPAPSVVPVERPPRPPGRAGPLSRYLLVLAVIAVAVSIYFTTHQPDRVAVLVTVHDLPAYHTITAADFTLGTRNAGNGEKYAALPIEGRLSLKPIAKGQPLRESDVAPDVAQMLGADLTVHGFAVPPAAVLGDTLRAGDRIRLVLVRGGRLLARLDAVVLSVSPSDPAPTRTLVVALRTKDAQANDVAISTGTASVFKDPAAAEAPG